MPLLCLLGLISSTFRIFQASWTLEHDENKRVLLATSNQSSCSVGSWGDGGGWGGRDSNRVCDDGDRVHPIKYLKGSRVCDDDDGDGLWRNNWCQGTDTREELLAFHDKHYHAKNMALVVLGKENLDQLELVARECFGDVSAECDLIVYILYPLCSNHQATIIHLKERGTCSKTLENTRNQSSQKRFLDTTWLTCRLPYPYTSIFFRTKWSGVYNTCLKI